MGFRRKSDGLVAQGYAKFQKMVWMAIIKLPSIPVFGNLNTLAQQGQQISSDFLRNPILSELFLHTLAIPAGGLKPTHPRTSVF